MTLKLLVILLSFVAVSVCDHLILGDVNGKHMIYHTPKQHHRIPFTRRTKSFFYADPNQKIINAIVVYDNLQSKASATVTAGGIGFSFVNIRMQSERGKGLDYDIGIYS